MASLHHVPKSLDSSGLCSLTAQRGEREADIGDRLRPVAPHLPSLDPPFFQSLAQFPTHPLFLHPIQAKMMLGSVSDKYDLIGDQDQFIDKTAPVAQHPQEYELMTSLEDFFGYDLSDITIHLDSEKAQKINALAYTEGNTIYFAPGQFSISNQKGKQLIAHEVAHIVQQSEGKVRENNTFNDHAGK